MVIWVGLVFVLVGIILVILLLIIGCFVYKLDMWWLVIFSFIMYVVCFYWCVYIFELGMDFGVLVWL